jgi:S1-C subfamily serine protease
VKRPTLGVRTIPIGPELAEELGLPSDHGVLIVQVIPGSSGEKAGLRGGGERAYLRNIPIMLGGDLIVAIDGDEIVDQMDLARAMNRHRAGDTVTVTIYRGKQKMDVKVTLQEAK